MAISLCHGYHIEGSYPIESSGAFYSSDVLLSYNTIYNIASIILIS